jgi:transposase
MDAQGLTSPQRKLVMWYKVKELRLKGFNCRQIAHELDLHRHTVEKYDKMSLEGFTSSQAYEREFKYKLEEYEEEIRNDLGRHPYLSSRQVYDHLREFHQDFPEVSEKTVFNLVQRIRNKYGIPKSCEDTIRPFEKLPEGAPGESAQADFGEYWMSRQDSRRVKVYFFVIIMIRSRRKFVYFSRTPFTSALAIYAHQLAFKFYGGKPRKVIYDQDKVFISKENLGDVILTKGFQAFVSSEHFECVFCRKSDPQSKGKVENAVKYVKYNFLRGREFNNIDMLNESGLRWLARTANGLPHSSTKQVPDEAFMEELPYMEAYTGTPTHPQDGMKEYLVRKDNTINFHSHFYNVPTGTYNGDNTFVWVCVKDNQVEIYSNETGKRLALHPLATVPGEAILDETLQRPKLPSRKELENYILSYLDGNALVAMWLKNLYETKPRYYRANINMLNSELESFMPEALIKSFEVCLDKSDYNAKDLISYCERNFGHVPKGPHEPTLSELLPPVLQQGPDRTNMNDYKAIFA